MTTLSTATRIAALAAALLTTTPAVSSAQTTHTFEGIPTPPAAGHTAPLTSSGPYQFENFRVMSTSETFGSGANASSGVNFAYGLAFAGASYIYRTDRNFTLFDAYLSFRAFDGDVSPATVVVRGYRGPDEVYARTLTLTNSARLFTFDFANVEEIAFETGALDATRSAVLALDDVRLAAVPEPGTVALTAAGLLVLALGARRRDTGS
jgi:hypothetical protein